MSRFLVFVSRFWLGFSIIFSVFVVVVVVTVPLWGPWAIYSAASVEEPKPPCPEVQHGAFQYPETSDDMSILSEAGHSKHVSNF